MNNGPPKAISTGNPLAFSMNLFGLGVVTEATPSSLAKDGQSFNVCAYAPDCAAAVLRLIGRTDLAGPQAAQR